MRTMSLSGARPRGLLLAKALALVACTADGHMHTVSNAAAVVLTADGDNAATSVSQLMRQERRIQSRWAAHIVEAQGAAASSAIDAATQEAKEQSTSDETADADGSQNSTQGSSNSKPPTSSSSTWQNKSNSSDVFAPVRVSSARYDQYCWLRSNAALDPQVFTEVGTFKNAKACQLRCEFDKRCQAFSEDKAFAAPYCSFSSDGACACGNQEEIITAIGATLWRFDGDCRTAAMSP